MNSARILVAALVLMAAPALADTVHWINPAGGLFEGNANWDRGTPPGNGDTALFDIPGSYTVNLTADHVVSILSFTRGDVTLNLGTHWLSAGSQQFFGGMSVVPAPNEGLCAAHLIGGTMPLWGLYVGAGATLSVSATHMSDTIGPGGASALYAQGATLLISTGGFVNTEIGEIRGATVGISSGGVLTAQFLQTTQPSTITVTGAGSRLGAEDGLSVSGALHITGGGQVSPNNAHVTMTNCQATVDGSGAVIAAGVDADAASTLVIQDGGVFNSLGTSYLHGAVALGQRSSFSGSAVFYGPCTVDIDTTLTFAFMYFSAPLTVALDGLSTRTTPIFTSTFNELGFTGPLNVTLRNPNALRNGRVFHIVQHGTSDLGSFSSLNAPTINGGRTLTMTQTLGAGGVVTVNVVPGGDPCWSADFDGDGDTATDADIESLFACIAGNCCATCGSTDFNSDGDSSTDTDIEAFFRVLAGGNC